MIMVESISKDRYQILNFDSSTNCSWAVPFEDGDFIPFLSDPSEREQRSKDLLMSEVFELKNIWAVYNQKINSLLTILPQEALSRYELVIKGLQTPSFDMSRRPSDTKFIDILDEIIFKMA